MVETEIVSWSFMFDAVLSVTVAEFPYKPSSLYCLILLN
ncbi:hypothetical protein VME0621_03416 [Vibrio mediterranei]|nr:hypothetical protein VME0621_03416 [Vibrio mediterranei]